MPETINPTTGERHVLQNGQWVSMGTAPASGSATVARTPLPAFIPAAPNPRLQRAEARADEDQAMQREAAARADAAAARAAATADRVAGTQAASEQRQSAADARASEKMDWARQDREAAGGRGGAKATEAQTKSAQFLGRMMLAEREFQSVDPESRDPRNVVGQAFRDWAPGLENVFNSDGRQRADQSVENFIAASLRQESGAAIGKDEFARQYAIFFPQPGDGSEVLEQKARARAQAIEGFKAAAGPLADAAIQTVTGVAAPARNGVFDPETQVIGEAGLEQGDGSFRGKSTDKHYQTVPEVYGFGAEAYFDDNGLVYSRRPGVEGESKIYDPTGRTLADDYDPSMIDAGVRSAADTLTFGVADKLAAGGDAVLGALSGDGSFSELYGVERARQKATTDKAWDYAPVSSVAGAVAGSIAPANALGRLAAGTRIGTTPFRAAVAGDATYGAAYGVGSSDSLAEVPGNALAGGAVGGAGSAGIRRLTEVGAPVVGNALARLGRNPSAKGQGVARAAQAEGVSILPADVAGPGIRRATAATAQMPLGARPIIKGSQETARTFDEATTRVANDMGTSLDDVDLGDTVRRGAERFSDRTSATGGRLYDRAERMSRGVKIKSQGAAAEFTSLLDEFGEAGGTNKALVDELTRIAGDVFDAETGALKPQSVRALQDIRSNLRTMARNPDLRGTRATYAAGRLEQALTADIEGGLTSAGRTNAVGALRKADDYWKQRVEHIDEVLQPLLGKNRSGEDVAKAVSSLVEGKGGGVARLRGVTQSMTPEEAGNFRATLVDGLGKPGPGGRGAEGEGFSPNLFLTNWNKMTPPAKAVLFPEGAHRTSLNNLATVAAGVKDSGRFANSSQTGGVMGWLTTMGSASLDLKTLGGYSAMQAVMGKALASPKLVTILTKPARTATQRAERVVELGRLSARYPALAEPADTLARALQASPTRAAAEGGEEQNGGQPPPQ